MVIDRKTDEFILAALNEDIGDGDITTECTVADGTTASGKYIAKDEFGKNDLKTVITKFK